MPRVSRTRLIDAAPERVWDLVFDPHHLPRWWPLTARVEDVRVAEGGEAQWTKVLTTERGTSVRADFRRPAASPGEALAWEQELSGSPFERILKSARVAISLRPAGDGTEVRLTSDETLRGLSRLGSPMMRRATGRRLDEALDNLERALVGEGGGA
jgi:uncharacterized protein YndB with AHSA1/START domain